MRIANSIDMPPQNFVVGDADGNIGWTIAGRIPETGGLRPAIARRLEHRGRLDRLAAA